MALSRPPLGVRLQPTDTLVDLHRRCTAHFVGDVGVYIQCGAAGDVANNGGERFDVHAMFQTCCAKYMAQIVESNLFAPSPIQNDLQPFSDGGGVSWRIFTGWRGKHPAGDYGFLVHFKDSEDRSREDNAAVGCFRLRWRDNQFSFDPMNLPLNPEFPSAEVQIIPLESANLTSTQAGGEFQQEKFIAAVLFGLDQQPLDFLWCQHLHLPGLGRREAAAISRVSEDEFLCDSFVQGSAESGVDTPNGLIREPFAVELSSKKPAIFFELRIELLNVVGSQLVHLNISQRRDDALINTPLV